MVSVMIALRQPEKSGGYWGLYEHDNWTCSRRESNGKRAPKALPGSTSQRRGKQAGAAKC